MPWERQKYQTLAEAQHQLDRVIIDFNRLEQKAVKLESESKKKTERITQIEAAAQAEHQKDITNNYIRNDDKAAIITAAKSFKMITEEQAKSLRKTIKSLQKQINEHQCPTDNSTNDNQNQELINNLQQRIKELETELEHSSRQLRKAEVHLNSYRIDYERSERENSEYARRYNSVRMDLARVRLDMEDLTAQIELKD
jgi:chromosome segregation ATPase